MLDMSADNQLKMAFLRHQCRIRQTIVRRQGGRPSAAIMPEVQVGKKKLGSLITVLNKLPEYSQLPELRHIARHTQDPSLRVEKALKMLSEYYYQYPQEFCDAPMAVFGADSDVAKILIKAGRCDLHFSGERGEGQEFFLACGVEALSGNDYDYQAAWWHNYLFNPHLTRQAIVLKLQADWRSSHVTPPLSVGGDGDDDWGEG